MAKRWPGRWRKLPFLIKPNRDELSMLTGLPLETEAELLSAGRDLLARVSPVCAISLGSRGALILDASMPIALCR